ncbi:MAG: lipocalin family protein [Syntrophorhabdaceae bacterium]|nr:lipocalin family protein [Syntrophorhabdaceae bacterium]
MKSLLKAFPLLLFLLGCVGIPDNIEPVKNFDINRYLGRWYEIARLDHPFERGLEKVYGEYSLNNDGSIKVVNRGYEPASATWKEAIGKAYFVSHADIGMLKVSFFGPFYSSYNIIELDRDYSYALICSYNKKYLWILSRKPELDESIKTGLINKAKHLGFEIDKLIFVKQ